MDNDLHSDISAASAAVENQGESSIEDAGAFGEPPGSWRPEYRGSWGAIDPKVREYIHSRESDFHRGLEGYKTDAARMRHLQKNLEPYQGLLYAEGVTIESALPVFLQLANIMNNGSREQKQQLWNAMAERYGIAPQSATPSDGARALQDRLDRIEQWQRDAAVSAQENARRYEAEETVRLDAEIQQFSADHPHMDALRNVMADLLEAGLAKDLTEAYDKALRWDPNLSAQQQAQAAKIAAQNAKTRASITGAPKIPTGSGTGSEGESLRDTIAAAMQGQI